MNSRRVLFQIGNPELRLVITERSTIALEPHTMEFATLEDAAEWVTIHPQEVSSTFYNALLERLEAMGGGGLM